MVIAAYQYSNVNDVSEGYVRFCGAFESGVSADFQSFDLFPLATVDATLAFGSNEFRRTYYFSCDCYVFSDISAAVNLQSYGGLPGKYRLGECQFALGGTVTPGTYLNYLSQYIGTIVFYAGFVAPPAPPTGLPIISFECDEIGYPFAQFRSFGFNRNHAGVYTSVRVQPESGVLSRVYVAYAAESQPREAFPGKPGFPYFARC